jgi:photosystem II stability/assembly factor-like uncharacterized protein
VGGLPTSTVNGFAVHPNNPNVMYAAMRPGVFRSDDGGAKWMRATGPQNAAAIATHPIRRTEVYVATTQGRIMMSRDLGKTWSAVSDRP